MCSPDELLGILKDILTKAPIVWSSDDSVLFRRASKAPAEVARRDTDPHTLPGNRGGCSTWAGETCKVSREHTHILPLILRPFI